MQLLVPQSVDGPTREFLMWVARCPRTYATTMDAWASHCPRFMVWEDALAAGLVQIEPCSSSIEAACVSLTPQGQAALVSS